MFSFSRVVTAFTLALSLSSGVYGIGQITRVGRYLYSADGSRWYIKGVAYQEQGASAPNPNAPFSEPTTFIDPLANATACQRDLPFLQQLGVNTIRVYSVDATLNHDSCMQALSGAGIYVILDLTLPVNGSIDRTAPTWTTNLLDSYIATINVFLKYDNVLAYNIGNEIVVSPNGTNAGPFIKAAARDIKAYLKSKSSTALVGYAAIDGDDTWIVPLASYLACDPSGSNSGNTAIDIYGLNNYEYCGNSTFAASYAIKTGDFAGLNIVGYFSEFGCNNPSPRVWNDVSALFSPQAAPVWSGGVAFSYFPAQSDLGQYGIITLSADGSTVTTSTDYNNLQIAYSNVKFVDVPPQTGAPAATYPACPAENSTLIASTTLPPTPNDAACQCLDYNLSCRFNPQTSNTTAIVGALIDSACGLLGTSGGNCNDLAGNGQTGSYGLISACDPSTKASYAMALYYEANKRQATACSFAGNGTENTSATASAAVVASSCLASATGTFVPTAPATVNNPGTTSTSGSSSSSSKPGAATTVLVSDSRALLGVFLMVAVSVAGGFMSLA
ncbi:glycoside hydrolase family 72 protein [Russula earlei]|uniref:Glycoside hydrolase family 72 protein n=1 Tax=Russula earlei TaxID=71964 RepID=A0ACC0UPJ8_9AGAM|nr:glycoside hydrolase family 72 protein [Russula earlei]